MGYPTCSTRCGPRPAIVLADEPSGNLDESHSGVLHGLFVDLNRRFGQAFVVVTHDPLLAKLGHRQLRMHQGVLSELEACDNS